MNFSAIRASSALGKCLRAPLKLIPKDAALPVLQGPLRGRLWIAGSSNHGCWLGSYEYRVQRSIDRAIPVGGMVWDIGANVGFYSLLAARKACQVVSVEPLAANAVLLRKHLALNHVDNVEVLEMAVWRESTTLRFTSHGSLSHIDETGQLVVRTITLDDMLARFGPPALIKMDVEGAEYDALRGAERCLREAHPIIFLAADHDEAIRNSCCGLLHSANYQADEIGPGQFFCQPA
jgi:FkbM family methyltransferase